MSNIVMFLYRGHSTSTSLGKWKGIDQKSDKKLHRKRTCGQKIHVPHALLCAFFCGSIFPSWFEALIILQRATRKAHPRAYQCIWDNYVILPQKYCNSTTLSMWVVYAYMCLKMRLCLDMWFSTSFDIIWYTEAAI